MTIVVTSDAVEITRLITSSVTALVWPGVVLAVVFMLRPYFAEIIGRASGLEWGNFKVALFEKKLETAEQRADRIPVTPQEGVEPPAPPEPAPNLPPDYLVLEAWRRVEAELMQAAERSGISLGRNRSPLLWSRSLRSRGVLDNETMALLDDLRGLRNAAVHHDAGPPIEYDQALRYRDLADLVVTRLQRVGELPA